MILLIRRRLLLPLLLVFGMMLAGCGLGRGSGPPDLTLTANGLDHVTVTGTYCWDGLCVDTVYPPVVETFVELAPGEPLELAFARPQPATAFMALDRYDTFPNADSAASQRLDPVTTPIIWSPDLPAGDYVLLVSAQWDDGDASYHMGVTIP